MSYFSHKKAPSPDDGVRGFWILAFYQLVVINAPKAFCCAVVKLVCPNGGGEKLAIAVTNACTSVANNVPPEAN